MSSTETLPAKIPFVFLQRWRKRHCYVSEFVGEGSFLLPLPMFGVWWVYGEVGKKVLSPQETQTPQAVYHCG